MQLDLISGKVNLLDPGKDSTQEYADIKYMTMLPQWQSYRSWMLRQAVDFYRSSGTAAKDEAFILSRFGSYICDTLSTCEAMSTEEEKSKTDTFDDADSIREAVTPNSDLPLAPIDE